MRTVEMLNGSQDEEINTSSMCGGVTIVLSKLADVFFRRHPPLELNLKGERLTIFSRHITDFTVMATLVSTHVFP
jgi:hypothetical protein